MEMRGTRRGPFKLACNIRTLLAMTEPCTEVGFMIVVRRGVILGDKPVSRGILHFVPCPVVRI